MHIYTPPARPYETYTQGFWYAIIAACLYLVCSIILMVNMLGYFLGHYPDTFTLTDAQRTLILQTMLFFIWLAGGGGLFSRIETDHGQSGWAFVDAVSQPWSQKGIRRLIPHSCISAMSQFSPLVLATYILPMILAGAWCSLTQSAASSCWVSSFPVYGSSWPNSAKKTLCRNTSNTYDHEPSIEQCGTQSTYAVGKEGCFHVSQLPVL